MKIGIFGGSFNPVHIGHYEIVNSVLKAGLVDKVIVVPAYQNPFKNEKPEFKGKVRLAMLKATFEATPEVEISTFELDQKDVSYSYRTIEHFHNQNPKDQLHLILGEDSFNYFPQWKSQSKILEIAKIIVIPRKCEDSDCCKQNSPTVTWFEGKVPEISSSEIRDLNFSQMKQRGYIPPKALEAFLKITTQ